MPRVVEVAPKDIYVLMEVSVTELAMLRKAMDMATISFDGKDEAQSEAANYFKDTFYGFIDRVLEDVKHYGS